jgi:hypothetical protein
MNYELTLSASEAEKFRGALSVYFDEVREPVQNAMSERFFEIVRSNFGEFGVDRPTEWTALTPGYAKRVGRDNATLFVTGKLESSVKMENTPDCGRVSVSDSDCAYALAQNFGYPPNNLPPRPFFPVDSSGEITQFTRGQVEEAATEEFYRMIRTVL